MIFLIFSILSSSSIYIIFKIAVHYGINIFPIITINYLVAAFIGYFTGNFNNVLSETIHENWFYISVILGVLFILMFYIIGLSTHSAGITLTSISSKMSVVVPVLFSIIYYNEKINFYKITGILLAISSIFLSSLKDDKSHLKAGKLLFPALLFLGMGVVDSLVKYNQEEFLKYSGVIESSTICFGVSALIGIIIFFYNFKNIYTKVVKNALILGSCLGLANFGSLYFLIEALNSNFSDSSIIFALNNTLIIVLTTLTGRFIFKEKLLTINWIGIFISITAIFSLSL